MFLKRFLFIPALLISLSGCMETVDFDIDNPTDQPFTITVDEQNHNVPAHSAVSLSLAPGEYRLKNDALGEVRMIVYANGRGGLINPTLSEYVIATEEYGSSNSRSRETALLEIELDGVTIEGPYRKVSGFFIERDWDYGTRSAFPEVLYSSTRDDMTDVKRKIFSVRDFIPYLEAATGEPGAYSEQNPDGYRPPAAVLAYTPGQLPDLHPLLEAHAKPMRDHYAQYLQATNTKEQRRLKSAGHQVVMDYIDATVTLHHQLSPEDNRQATQFTTAFGQSRGMSAAMLPVPPS